MRKGISLLLFFTISLSFFTYLMPMQSFASGYELTEDSNGTGFTTGSALRLSNGDTLIFNGINKPVYRYNSKLEQKPLHFDYLNEWNITEIGQNRFFSVGKSLDYYVRGIDGTEISKGKLSDIDPDLRAISYITYFSNSGKILISGSSMLLLLDSDLHLLKKTTLKETINGVEQPMSLFGVYGFTSYKGDILSIVNPSSSSAEDGALRVYRISDDLTYEKYVYPGLQKSYSSIMELGNGNLFLYAVDGSVLLDQNFNLKEFITNRGRYSYYWGVQSMSFPLGDGTVLAVGGTDSGSIGFQIINAEGNEIYSQATPNIAGIAPLGNGRFILMKTGGSYTIYVTPTGKLMHEIPDLSVPNNLRLLTQSGDDTDIGWYLEANPTLDHFEVYVNNTVVGTDVTDNTFKTKLAAPGLYSIQVAAVDNNNRKTDLSTPLFVTKSQVDDSSDVIDAMIKSGINTLSFNPIIFTDVTLNNKDPMVSNGDTTLTINDSRGTGAGWSVQLAVSDFESSPIPNPSGSGTFKVRIPASFLHFATDNPALITGQGIDSSKMTYSPSGTLSNAGQSLINATPGTGMGIYGLGIRFTLNVPQRVHVLNVTDSTDSKIVNGEIVGLYAGNYTSTFTFTTGVGL